MMTPARHVTLTNVIKLLAALLVLFSLGQCLLSIVGHDDTYDEYWHWSWSERMLLGGNGDRSDASNYVSTTPIILVNILFRQHAKALGFQSPDLILGRLPGLMWYLGIFALVFLIGRLVGGPLTPWLALILTALDPNLIAHASVATVDAAFACTTLLVLFSVILIFRKPALGRFVLFGAALGLAFSTKFTAMLLLPLLCGFPLLYRTPPQVSARTIVKHAAGLGIAAAVALFVICSFYLYIRVGMPLASIQFRSPLVTRLAQAFPAARLPLPEAFLTGIDYCYAADSGGGWQIYFLNQYLPNGVGYFFPVVWLLKTPLIVILLTVSGLCVGVRENLLKSSAPYRLILFWLLLLGAYFCFIFRTMVGIRYVLMCLPMLYLLAAAGLERCKLTAARTVLLAVLLLSAAVEIAFYTGNTLAFTNAAVQPKRSVYKLITDSNINWGQRRYSINGDLLRLGIPDSHLNPPHLQPGYNVIDLNHLMGVWWNRGKYQWIRDNLEPLGHLGHTHLLYFADEREFQRHLAEKRAYTPVTGSNCDRISTQSYMERQSLSGELPASWCLHAEPDAVVSVTNRGALLRLGLRMFTGTCALEELSPGHTVWYKLAPGFHELCVSHAPRAELEFKMHSGAVRAAEMK